MKKYLLFLLLIFTLTGCWDKDEIEEEAFVIAIGLDQSEVPAGILITYQIANPQVGIPNTGGEKEVASEIITFNAPDFLTGRDLANASVARDVNFAHTKLIVISEQFARTKKAANFISSALRDREIRRDIKLVVSKERAADFIKNNNPKLETRPHKFFDLMTGRWEETGLVPLATLQRFIQSIESSGDGFLAVYASSEKGKEKYGNEDDYLPGQIDQEGGNTTQLIGSAVFHNGIMVGSLTGEETRLALNLRPKALAKTFKITYPDPLDSEYRIAANLLRHKKTKIELMTKTEPLVVNITVPLDFEILAIPSGQNYVTSRENQELLRSALEKGLKEKFEAIINKSKKEHQINTFNWSHVARKHFLTMQAYESYNFEEKFKNAEVNVKVNVAFKGFGKQLKPPKIIRTTEEN